MDGQQQDIETLAELGATLLNVVATVRRMGHVSPVSTLDYLSGINDGPALIVKDFIAWTCARKDKSPGCVERLYQLIDDLGWDEALIESAAHSLPRT